MYESTVTFQVTLEVRPVAWQGIMELQPAGHFFDVRGTVPVHIDIPEGFSLAGIGVDRVYRRD